MTPPVVVKIGGSLITRRDAPGKEVDEENLARLANELLGQEAPLVLVHGAGSFGHVLAREHRLAEKGLPRTRERMAAFAEVHEDVAALDAVVVKVLRKAGLAPAPVRPTEYAHMSAGEIDRFDLDAFARPLAFGLVPVTWGDAVHDDAHGWNILGGDVAAARIAAGLGAPLLVHATDVAGVYDRPPQEAGATVLPELAPDEADALAAGKAGAAAGRPDVTGGMAGKLRASAEAARAGTAVLVLDGRVPGRLADALAGKSVSGTWIRRRS